MILVGLTISSQFKVQDPATEHRDGTCTSIIPCQSSGGCAGTTLGKACLVTKDPGHLDKYLYRTQLQSYVYSSTAYDTSTATKRFLKRD